MMTKPWNEYRAVIVRLYIDEGRTLTEVRETMNSRYNFSASIRSYRQHFDQWHVGKYTCKKRDLRRKQALARQKAMTPPRTPMIVAMPPMNITYKEEPATSPESLTRSSSISSSSGASPASDASPRSMDHRPMMMMPTHYDGRGMRHPVIGTRAPRIKYLTAEGGVWEEPDLHGALRTPGAANEILAYPMDAATMDANKGPGRLLPAIYQETEWCRPAPYYVHSKAPEYHRQPYADTVPRFVPMPFETSLSFPRVGDYQQPLPPRPIPRLPAAELEKVERVAGD